MLLVSFLLLGIFVIVAQTTFLQVLPDWVGRPDLIHILIAFAAYRFGWMSGLLYAIVLGWMLDVVAGIHLGIYPLQSILVFSALKLLTEKSPLKEHTYQVPLVGLSYFIVQMLFFSFYSILMPETLPEWSWNRVIKDTFILLFATIPAFVILNRFFEFFQTRRVIHRVMRKRGGNQFR